MQANEAALNQGPVSTGGEADELLQPWYMPERHFEELPGVMCATDLLIAWKPDVSLSPLSASPSAAPWDAFFLGSIASSASPQASTHDATDEPWDPASSAAAVDCLFRFVHALEQQDIEEAMLCVSADFHTLERDIDLDRAGLRVWLERRIDEWRGPELRIGVTEIPDPVPYEAGVVIHTTLQVDYRNTFHDRIETLLFGYLILFESQPQKPTLIRSLCRVS